MRKGRSRYQLSHNVDIAEGPRDLTAKEAADVHQLLLEYFIRAEQLN